MLENSVNVLVHFKSLITLTLLWLTREVYSFEKWEFLLTYLYKKYLIFWFSNLPHINFIHNLQPEKTLKSINFINISYLTKNHKYWAVYYSNYLPLN